jgi:hypothetical protein
MKQQYIEGSKEEKAFVSVFGFQDVNDHPPEVHDEFAPQRKVPFYS